jgi:hypothetical protein
MSKMTVCNIDDDSYSLMYIYPSTKQSISLCALCLSGKHFVRLASLLNYQKFFINKNL